MVEVLSLTMNPITASRVGVLGNSPTSKNSCRLPASKRATSTISTKPVTLKKRRRLIRRLPLTISTPKSVASPSPDNPPSKPIRSGVPVSERAARNRIISTPSRKTMKKTKAKMPQPWRFAPEVVSDSRRSSTCCLMPREVRHIQTTRLNTSIAAIASSVPSSTSFSGSKPARLKTTAPKILKTTASPSPA